MTPFHSAVMPVPVQDFSRNLVTYERLLELARWIGCDVHLFLYGNPATVVEEGALSALAGHAGGISLSIHRGRGELLEEIRDLITTSTADLILINTDPGEKISISIAERELLRGTDLPALLVPRGMSGSGIPRSLLIPFTPEKNYSRALDLGIRIGNEKRIPLDLLHVAGEDSCNCEGLVLEKFGDQGHHEYLRMLDEMVAKAAPFSTLAERHRIRSFKHAHGELGEVILQTMRDMAEAWLVLEWKGSMEPGHAKVIKRELSRYRYPILLVHSAGRKRFQLKVGPDFKAA